MAALPPAAPSPLRVAATLATAALLAAGCGTAARPRAATPAAQAGPGRQAVGPAPPASPPTTDPAAPLTTTPTAPDPGGAPAAIGPLRLLEATVALGPLADQGLATRRLPDGRTTPVTRGDADVTPDMTAAGWTHIGDPGAWGGWLVDAWQGRPDAKLFVVTSPAGVVTDVVHPLAAGEAANDSFVAVDPGGRWLVSGEWGDEHRLLVLPAPWPAAAGPEDAAPVALPGSLALAGAIRLRQPVRDVQGCDFADPVTLLCATADPGRDLWPTPDQLLEVRLDAPLAPGRTSPAASVAELGGLPSTTACGPAEPEGVDVDRAARVLRVDGTGPGRCGLATHVAAYLLPPGL